MRSGRARALAAACGIGVLLASTAASAQKVPALAEINPALPNPPRAELAARRSVLDATRTSLSARSKYYNDHCQLYSADDPVLSKRCPQEKAQFPIDREAYASGVKSFNWDLEQEVGGYRLSLEKRIQELDEGLAGDALAVQRLGFKRRAQDFDDLANLSIEAHRQAFLKIADVLIDEAGPLVVERTIGKLRAMRATGLSPAEAKALLAQFDEANLVNPKARAYLREVARGMTPGTEAKLAGAIQEDLQAMRDVNATGKAGENKEAALKLLQWIGPPGIGSYLELGVWVTYDALAQAHVSGSVEILSKATADQLKGLSSIMCLSQRRLVEKHEVGLKLAALQGRPLDRPAPVINSSCRKS